MEELWGALHVLTDGESPGSFLGDQVGHPRIGMSTQPSNFRMTIQCREILSNYLVFLFSFFPQEFLKGEKEDRDERFKRSV